MPNSCACTAGACSCLIVSGPGMRVTGFGSGRDPYVLDSAPSSLTFDAASGVLDLGAPGVNVSNPSTVVRVTATGDTTIVLPDAAMIPGSIQLQVLVNAPAGVAVSFSNVATWFGPTSTGSGMYTFMLAADSWMGSASALAA